MVSAITILCKCATLCSLFTPFSLFHDLLMQPSICPKLVLYGNHKDIYEKLCKILKLQIGKYKDVHTKELEKINEL